MVDYRINQITNARNRVTQIEGEYVLQAAGAAYVNAFAFELPIAADIVKSVSGNKVNTGGPYSWNKKSPPQADGVFTRRVSPAEFDVTFDIVCLAS